MVALYSSESLDFAKEKERKNWIDNSVYEEVDNMGQNYISARWIVTEKMKQGKPEVKPRLVAIDFEENTSYLRKYSSLFGWL